MRRFSVMLGGLVLASGMVASACGRGGTANITELQRVRSGMLDVVLLSPRMALRHGNDAFIIEFRAASDRHLVDVGEVRGSATMPMAGVPMLGSLDVKRTNVAGRYDADAKLSMAGTWRLSFEWNGPAGQGAVTVAGPVQ